MIIRKRNTLIAALLFIGTFSSGVDALSFTITELGTLGGSSTRAYGINNSGQITGYSTTVAGNRSAFLYDGGAMTDLGGLDGLGSEGRAINDSGEVTGISAINSIYGSLERAFLYDGSTMNDLGTLGGFRSQGYGINDSGHVTGVSTTSPSDEKAFIYDDDGMRGLGDVGFSVLFSEGWDINNRGQITGRSTVPGNIEHHAFLYEAGTLIDLGTLGGLESVGRAINENGHVTGSSATSSGTHAFLHDGNSMIDLGTAYSSGASAGNDLNDLGQVVGSGFFQTTGQYAFLYDTALGGMVDLQDYIDPLAGWTLWEATGINNQGQITGYGSFNGQLRSFILTPDTAPIPEPTTITLLGLGLVALMVRRHGDRS